jgi:FKBP-type peptidyl-prolyl cis-trans isomerase FkpA
MQSNINIIIFSMLLTFVIGCDNVRHYNEEINNDNSKDKKESLVKVNKYLVNTENTEIDNYIRRHNLDVTKTGSGLKYQITKPGTGDTAVLGKIVTMNYRVKLITGDIIYSSSEDGPLSFEIGHGGVESGLEEAILNFRVGDEAIIIIPSHLGYGLLGDNKKIPQRSTIIYEIEITNIN